MILDHTVYAECRLCGKVSPIECNKEDLIKWKNKEGYVQDLLHYLSADQRELLISGTCGECFDSLFPPDDEDE
jgi:hypothetical protein